VKVKYTIHHKLSDWSVAAHFVSGRYVGCVMNVSGLAMSNSVQFWWHNCVPRREDLFVAKMAACPRIEITKEIID